MLAFAFEAQHPLALAVEIETVARLHSRVPRRLSVSAGAAARFAAVGARRAIEVLSSPARAARAGKAE